MTIQGVVRPSMIANSEAEWFIIKTSLLLKRLSSVPCLMAAQSQDKAEIISR
jgi:hypothetical protein